MIVVALYKEDSSQCPEPISMIPFWNHEKDKWPTKQTVNDVRRGSVGCLRQTKPYSDFIVNFARCFLSAKTFETECKTKSLSQMMGSTCEAFAVIDYANNFISWKNEIRQDMGEEVSDLSEEGSTQSIKPYTGGVSAKGKYKGWSGEGLELYDRVVELLEEQRKHDKHGNMFEVNLKNRWKDQVGRKRQRPDGEGPRNSAGTNRLKLFMEERGIA